MKKGFLLGGGPSPGRSNNKQSAEPRRNTASRPTSETAAAATTPGATPASPSSFSAPDVALFGSEVVEQRLQQHDRTRQQQAQEQYRKTCETRLQNNKEALAVLESDDQQHRLSLSSGSQHSGKAWLCLGDSFLQLPKQGVAQLLQTENQRLDQELANLRRHPS
ncbi:p53 and DNA damage-regulated protein 1 [Balamuthia mandrillaris]